MTLKNLMTELRQSLADWQGQVQDENASWRVKGVVDTNKKVYAIPQDTKVISKIFEICLLPRLMQFAKSHQLQLELPSDQNVYPDVTLTDRRGVRYAIDLKSSYRRSEKTINGLTLGAFTGYFRNRTSHKNVVHPYGDYRHHLVLGVLYSLCPTADQNIMYDLDALAEVPSVLRDIRFFVQEKWRIALDRPGSRNTKNIGSVTNIKALVEGKGPFAQLGEAVFDDYWMKYLTKDMARQVELAQPYHNLAEYLAIYGRRQ